MQPGKTGMYSIILLLIAILLGAVGQLLMKHGVNQVPAGLGFNVASLRMAVSSPFIVGGFVSYGISSMFWIIVISRLPLSFAYPMIALSYVVVTVGSLVILKEQVPALRWLALLVICIGVGMLAYTRGPEQARPAPSVQASQTEAVRGPEVPER